MSFDSLYNSNPNLKLKILQDLVDEYKGYIAGASVQNEFGIFGSSDGQAALDSLKDLGLSDSILGNDESAIEKIQKAIVNKFMYSSGGCYQMHELLSNLSIYDNIPKNATIDDKNAATTGIDDAIVVLFEPDAKLSQMTQIRLKESDAINASHDYHYQLAEIAVAQEIIDNMNTDNSRQFSDADSALKGVQTDSVTVAGSMKKMLASVKFEDKILDKREYENLENGTDSDKAYALRIFNNHRTDQYVERLISNARIKSQGGTTAEEEIKEETPDQLKTAIEDFKNNVLPIRATDKSLKSIKKDFINKSVGDPNTTAPSLSAVVIKKPTMSLNSRNDNFLAIFLGAVSQLELSRCTPYLTLTFFNEAKTKKGVPHRDYLDNIAYMKFAGGKDGIFSTSDGTGLGDSIPTFSQGDISKDRHGSIGNMDIFTAPQTMVNANINKKTQSESLLSALENIGGSHIENLDNVLDPFAPMMSLKSFQVTVQGGQYYLVTNRRASVSITLHDRSRLTDISPFVSLNEVARTIVRVEHGWSHPEGDIIRSKNPIGRFLNSMRETSYYQLTSSDFTFNGNTVTINMILDFFGFTDFVDANVAFGEKRPLNSASLQKKISRAFDDILANQMFKQGKIKPPKKGKEQSDEIKKQNKEKIKKQGRVIKTLKILRTHSQNSSLAVDTEKANEFEAFIDENITGNDSQLIVNNKIVYEFLKKLFDLLELKNIDNFKLNEFNEETSINEIKDIFGKKGFTEAINENLRFSYAKEVIEKIESLIGYDYNVSDPETKKIQKKINTSPDPEKTKEEEKKKKETTPTPEKTETIISVSPATDSEGNILKKNLTPDYFLTARCFKSGAKFERVNGVNSGNTKYTSLGKLICGMVALPSLATASNYSEVQVFFYPINNQAGGARKYTTASLPINNQELLSHVQKAIDNNFELTLKGFFEILSNMLENNNLDIYKISSRNKASEKVEKDLETALLKDKENGHKIAYSMYKTLNGRTPSTQKEKEIAFNHFKKKKREQLSQNIPSMKSILTQIYKDDNCGPAPTDKFLKPILQLEIESLPVIVPRKSNAVSSDSLLDLYAKEFEYNFLSPNEKDMNALTGIDDSKRVLRLHIYDSNSTQKPFEKIAMESAIEFDKFIPFAGDIQFKIDSGEINLSSPLGDGEKTLGDGLREVQGDVAKAFKKMSPNELKQYMIRSFPTIRYGSQVAVVKNISVRSNTTESIINARLMNEIKQEDDKKKANIEKGNKVKEDFSTFVIPTSVDITLYGCPFITVGNCIYLDLGTGTDIDNVYMVTDVNHQIGPGEYSTSITVAMPAQGSVKSTKDRLVTMINGIGDVQEF